MNRTWIASWILASAMVSSAFAAEGEWSRFRGPNGSGISDATTVPTTWTDQDYRWKVALPGVGHSSPVVWKDRVFVTCGDPNTARRTVLCLDAADGHVVWRRDFESHGGRQHGDNSYASATPAVDADGIVLGWSTSQEVVVTALDLDGRDMWQRELGPYVGLHGSGASPILLDGLVVFINDQEDPKALREVYGNQADTMVSGRSSLFGLERKTGKTQWRLDRRTSQSAYATPCVFQPAGGLAQLIVTSTAEGMTSVDPATGKVNWALDKIFADRCVSSPVATPELIIAGDGYGTRGTHYVAVRGASAATGGQEAIAFEVKKTVPLVPTPLVKDGLLFLWGDDGVVSCVKTETGELAWRERVGGSYYGSPVWVDNRLFAIDRKGVVVVIAAADKFEVLARNALGETSHATPAVAGGVMYLRTQSTLFALGKRRS